MTSYDSYKSAEPVVEGPAHQVCCISFNQTDRLRLIACPPCLIPEMRKCIEKAWGRIQNERSYHGSYEFKLNGRPWVSFGSDAVLSRHLLGGVLQLMARHGWNLLMSVDCSKKHTDKDTLFFEQGVPDEEASHFVISFNKFDRIRIIGSTKYFQHLKEAVRTSWPYGIQNEGKYAGSWELKLAGYPWAPEGEQAVTSKILLAQIISNFKAVGYKLYASVDISAKVGEGVSGGDLDTWVFRKVTSSWS